MPQKSKRVGRPPKDPRSAKSVQFTTRIFPDVRDDLKRAAEANGRSLSQEIESRLKESLNVPPQAQQAIDRAFDNPLNYALAVLVARLASSIDMRVTNTMPGPGYGSWRRDRFAWEALRYSVALLLERFAPEGEVRVPEPIAEGIRRQQKLFENAGVPFPENEKYAETPQGLASAITLGLIDQIERSEPLPKDIPKNRTYAEEFYLFPLIKSVLEHVEDDK